MIVKIDLTVLPQNKDVIIQEIKKRFQLENSHDGNYESSENTQSIDNDIIDINVDKKTHFKSIQQKIKDILIEIELKIM